MFLYVVLSAMNPKYRQRKMLTLAFAFITCALAGPCFPMLNHTGPFYGVQYSSPSNSHVANTTNQDYADIRAKGATLFQLSLTWKSIEPVAHQINFDMVADLLLDIRLAKMTPMFNLAVIDTNNIAVPPDLADPNNRFMLAPGLRWTDDVIAARYKALLDVIAPLVLFSGGFYFGFANEVDATLQAVSGSVADDFAAFAVNMRGYLQYTTSPLLSCGVTLTVGGVNAMANNPPSWLTSLLTQMDATPLTFYPIEGMNATVLEPSLAVEAMGAAIAFLPWNRCVIFQELGSTETSPQWIAPRKTFSLTFFCPR